MDSSYEEKLESWIHKEKTGVNLLNTIGNLMYEKGIELVFYRKKLLEIGVSELLNYFSYSKNVIGRENNIEIALSISNKIHEMNLPPSKIDIGLLTSEFIELNNPQISYQDFLEDKLLHIIKSNNSKNKAKDVILYGFGRIGRLVARELIIQAGKGHQLRHLSCETNNLREIFINLPCTGLNKLTRLSIIEDFHIYHVIDNIGIFHVTISRIQCVRGDNNVLINYFIKDVSNRIGAKSIITTKPNKITLNNPVERRKAIKTMV